MAITQPIRDKNNVCKITEYYLNRGELRNYLLVVFSIHTALRISDILRLTWNDVYDFRTRTFREGITITEKKTGKSKIVALNKAVNKGLKVYKRFAEPGKPLFLNRRTGKAIGRVQAYRLIRAAGEALRFVIRVSCHALRKTFGYHAWKSGISPAVITEIYNHSSFVVTRRYLGITQDDMNAAYVGLSFS